MIEGRGASFDRLQGLLASAKREQSFQSLDEAIRLAEELREAESAPRRTGAPKVLEHALELEKQKEFNQKLVRLLPFVTMIFDLPSRSHTYVSANVEKMLGYTAEELVKMGSSFYERLYEPAALADTLANNKSILELEDGVHETKGFRLRHKNGTWVHVQRTVVVFERDAQGRPRSFLGVVEDLDERLKIDLGLRRVLDTLPVLIGHWNRDLKNLLANRAYEKYFGRRPNEIKGMGIQELLGEVGYRESKFHLEQVLQGVEQTFEREMRLPDGTRRSMLIKLIPDVHQAVVNGYFVIGVDITQIKDLEAANSEHKQFLQGLLNESPAKIFVKDLSGTYQVSNRAHAAEHGRRLEDIVGKTVFDLFPRAMAEQMQDRTNRIIESGVGKTYEIELKYAERLRWNLVSLFPLKNEAGKVYAVGGILTDIHESKLLKARYESLFGALDGIASVAMTDKAGLITFANQKFSEITGYSQAELLGQDHRILNSGHHPRSFFEEQWSRIAEGRAWNGEIRNRRKDGTFYWENTTIAPIRGAGSDTDGYVAIRFDVTAEKLAQETLMQSAKMSSLGEMAGGIAHEINNPLAIISGKAVQLRKRMSLGSLDRYDFDRQLLKIEETADRIAKIIKGLQSFSRNADADPMEMVDVSRIVEDTVELCRERFKSHSIDLRLKYPSNTSLECRPSQISQVIMNLLGNAFDAVGGREEKWVSLEVSDQAGRLRIVVTDSGSGIAPEVAEKMMHPFFTTKEVGKGTGLGLSISQGIVEAHQGQLGYDASSSNTRFQVDLPWRQSAARESDG